MKICFIAAGPIEWGSSRMRAYWVAENMQDATVVQFGEPLPPADVYIWQKTVDTKQVIIEPHARHYWDVCDPSWWWQPDECRLIADLMDGVVASSTALTNDFNEWYGKETAVYIPDRLNLSHFPKQRQHQDVDPVRFIWFGIAVNRIALWSAVANLERLVANGYNIELTIMDDRPDATFTISDKFPIYHTRWQLDKENEIIASHDIALLPAYPGPWGRVKSDNKALTAWACRLPVWNGEHYDENLTDLVEYGNCRELKNQNAIKAFNNYRNWGVSQSATEWEALLCS